MANTSITVTRSSSSSSEGDASVLSESNDERNITIGSVSLRDDLLSVGRLLANLKSSCPERNNPRRAKKNTTQTNKSNNDFMPKMIECLDTIKKLTTRIVDRIEELSHDYINLQIEFEKSNKKTYATATTEYSPPARSSTSPSLQQAAAVEPSTLNVTVMPPELEKISTRVDQLEQDSLSDTLLLQGPAIEELIAKDAHVEGTMSSELEERRRQPEPAALKRSICDLLRPIVPEFSGKNITQLSVQGKDRKHLRMVCSSGDEKVRVLLALKKEKPPNLFVNEYLTKLRSSLLYRARSLRRNYPSVLGAYSRNGSIFCRVAGLGKPILLSGMTEVNKLEEKLINSL